MELFYQFFFLKILSRMGYRRLFPMSVRGLRSSGVLEVGYLLTYSYYVGRRKVGVTSGNVKGLRVLLDGMTDDTLSFVPSSVSTRVVRDPSVLRVPTSYSV